MSIIVYSKPHCVQCNATYKALDKYGLDYSIIDISEDPAAYDHVVGDLGMLQVPVVEIAGAEPWAGFRPDRIKQYAQSAAAA